MKNDFGFNALCKQSMENNKSNLKNNDFWQWNMLENLSSSRGNRSSKLDNASCIGSSYTTQKGKLQKPNQSKSKSKKNSQKDKHKRENRCCSSIAAHNLNKSLLGPELDPGILEDTRKSNKICLKTKSKPKKTPRKKQVDSSNGDNSFQQKTSLNLSQMFNYYTNQPIGEKHHRKTGKNLQHAYRSYTSSSVSKKKQQRSKGGYPSIIVAPMHNRGRYTSTNQASDLRKSKHIAKILELPLGKYTKLFDKKSKSKSKGRSKGGSK